MLASVVALYNSAGPTVTARLGKESRAVLLRKKLALLFVAVMMAVAMIAAAPAFAQGQSEGTPQCERGQLSASLAQTDNTSPNDDPEAHHFMHRACLAGQVPSSEHPTNP